MMEIIFLILGLVPLCYWVYVHLNYQQIFKKEHPEEFEKNKRKGIGFVFGREVLEHGLSKKYKSIDSKKLFISGERLNWVHDKIPTFIGLFVLFVVATILLSFI